MKATSTRRLVGDSALGWLQRLQVEVGGTGTVAQAGVVLPRLLADRLGLTTGLAEVVARAGFVPVRHRGRALVDASCALAAGATCLSDIEAMTAQEEIFGPGGGASDSTMLRVLDELGERLGVDGLQLAALATSLTAWLRHIGLGADLAKASTKTLRFRILSAPARLVTHARGRILKIPPGWQWSTNLATAWNHLQALHPL